MSIVQERFKAKRMPQNSMVRLTGRELGGFLCVNPGHLTVINSENEIVVNNLQVLAGNFYRLPMFFKQSGGKVILTTNASGTLFV